MEYTPASFLLHILIFIVLYITGYIKYICTICHNIFPRLSNKDTLLPLPSIDLSVPEYNGVYVQYDYI